MSTINSVNGPQGLTSIEGMSLETAVMLVLSEKNQIFESQVMDRVKEMRDKNAELKRLGELASLVTARSKEFKSGAKTSDHNDGPHSSTINDAIWKENNPFDATKARAWVDRQSYSAETKARMKEDILIAEAAQSYGTNSGAHNGATDFMTSRMTLGAVETLQAQIKAQTDALGNETQLDQIGLQSAMNKAQNTAQLLSTLVKKFDDTHASINRNI
jgi:hypothetical protein